MSTSLLGSGTVLVFLHYTGLRQGCQKLLMILWRLQMNQEQCGACNACVSWWVMQAPGGGQE